MVYTKNARDPAYSREFTVWVYKPRD